MKPSEPRPVEGRELRARNQRTAVRVGAAGRPAVNPVPKPGYAGYVPAGVRGLCVAAARPSHGGWPLFCRKMDGLPPQTAFCHACCIVERVDAPRHIVIARRRSEESPLSSATSELKRAPFVSVSRSSSWMFTRPPGQPKLAGLLRSAFDVIDGTLPVLVVVHRDTRARRAVMTSTVGDSRWNLLCVLLACRSSVEVLRELAIRSRGSRPRNPCPR